VVGLHEIMAELHAAGRQPNGEAAQEIMSLLQAAKNHLPASEVERREYAQVLLQEYKEYVAERDRVEVGR
jgi:hypothetical protein